MAIERPILFSASMVRAILAGTKTQTRRVAKMPTGSCCLKSDCTCARANPKCPYGMPGDRLWVRETWAVPPGSTAPTDAVYRADTGDIREEESIRRLVKRDYVPWTPSIHMPRWASRITLEVTGVRVERLLDISEEDARAEGVTGDPARAREAFSDLWESLNGKRPGCSWPDNPWVWVLSFKRIDAPPP